MKLKDCLTEAGWAGSPNTNYAGQGTQFSGFGSGNQYRPSGANIGGDKLTYTLDQDIEAQLINQAIDKLFWEYPNLIKDKKIKRMHVQMLLGKITSGEVADMIDVDRFIKQLKKQKKIKTV
ncbi:hypothetical protein HN803_03010 [candidate division WWE3 bacterium]|jgi:hypothetical protein|nr:hypothetical protein [candidate division WWE3 bacterium]